MRLIALLLLTACGGGYSCDLDAQAMTARIAELRGESVQWSPVLAAAAQAHADDLARSGRAEHTGSDGSLPADWAHCDSDAPALWSASAAQPDNTRT